MLDRAHSRRVPRLITYRNRNIETQRDEQARGDRVVQEHVLTPEHLVGKPATC